MSIFKKNTLIFAALAMISLMAIGCSDDDSNPINSNTPDPNPTMDIVETAAADGRFTTLLAAATAADLVDVLKSEGPLTVFAPTDEAFDALPEGTVTALLNDPATLADILLYHVIPGKVTSTTVVTLDGEMVEMANGGNVAITVDEDGVMVNDTKVIAVDIMARNGVIHVIDGVLLP